MAPTNSALGTLQDLATASYDLIRHPFGGEAPPAPTPPAPPAGTIPPVAPRTQEDVKAKYGLPATADITKPYFDPANKDVKDADAFSRASQEFNPSPAKPSLARRALNLTGVTDIHGAEGGLAPRTVEETISPLEWIAGETAMEAAAPYINKVVGPVVSDVADRVSAWRQARDAVAGFEGRTINLQPSEYNFSDIGGTEVAPPQKALPAAPAMQPEAAVQPAAAKPAPIDFSEVGGTQIKPGGVFSGALNEGSTAEDKAVAGHMLQSTREQAETGLSPVVQKSAAPEAITKRNEVGQGVTTLPLSQNEVIKHFESLYPEAKDTVDGRTVREDTPNMSSIGATLGDYELLDGVREIPLSDFPEPPSRNARSAALAKEIENSKEINPLIVGLDNRGGPYIIEGSHRYDALKMMNAKSFPAVVAVDTHPDYMPEIPAEAIAKQAGLQYKGSMEGRGGEVYHTFDDPAKPGDQINVKQSELPAENVGQFLQDKMAAKRSQAGSTGETVEQMRQRILAEHGLGPVAQKSASVASKGLSRAGAKAK